MDIKNLPSDPEELKSIILKIQQEKESLNSTLTKSIRLLEEQNINLKFELTNLKAKLFHKSSEKWTKEETDQATLFDEIETYAKVEDPLKASLEQEASLFTKVESHSRKKTGRIKIPDYFPVEEVIHDIAEAEKVCSCGHHLTAFGSEKLDKVDIIPPQIKVTRHIRPKYVCPACHGLETTEESAVKIAPAVPQFLPKSIADVGLLAYMLVAKFCDAIPFYRLSNIFSRYGFEISRTTLCNYAKKTKERLDYLDKEFWEEILKSPLIQIDETPLQVLKEDKEKKSKSFMFVIRGGTPDKPFLKFIYHPTRSARFLLDMLKDYKGILQTDGYSSYDAFPKLNPNLLHAGCWVHARRKFMEILKLEKGNSGSIFMVEKIGLLYKLDESASLLSPEEKKAHRIMHSKPIVEEIESFLNKAIPSSLPKSPIGKAYRYMESQWLKLKLFLDHPEIPLDTNPVENAIRPFVVGRKNWLFSGTSEGAEASAFLYSLIETAKANKKEPYTYLKCLFTAVEKGESPKLLEVG